jgi:hypothetical protein
MDKVPGARDVTVNSTSRELHFHISLYKAFLEKLVVFSSRHQTKISLLCLQESSLHIVVYKLPTLHYVSVKLY